MSEMVERCVDAVIAAGYNPATAEAIVRITIEAMREPTHAMVEASNREWDGRMSHRSSGAWQAMIDAALR